MFRQYEIIFGLNKNCYQHIFGPNFLGPKFLLTIFFRTKIVFRKEKFVDQKLGPKKIGSKNLSLPPPQKKEIALKRLGSQN